MFGWFKSRDDVWKLSKRQIYTYSDGKKTIKADPMVLYKRYMDVRNDLLIDFKVANFEIPKGMPENIVAKQQAASKLADDKFLDKVCTIFAVKRFDGSDGLTEIELKSLLDHFLGWVISVKKNMKDTPTTATATSPNGESSSIESPPIPNGLVSGSIVNVPNTVIPVPSPTESPLPSVSLNQD